MGQGFSFGVKNLTACIQDENLSVANRSTFECINDDITLPSVIGKFLPASITDAIIAARLEGYSILEEIRLRAGRYTSFTVNGKNIMIPVVFSNSELTSILIRMCGGSLYSYAQNINDGFITLDNGIRVGVGGRAACDSGKVIGVSEISSLSIRIPHKLRNVGQEICDMLKSFNMTRGILIFAPPGIGKTTLLRGVITHLAGGIQPLRTVVIDTRGELLLEDAQKALCLDVLSGYPRPHGIEIAARTLNAEVIVCDEIGNCDEVAAIISAHNCGVPLVASAHAGDIHELLRKPGIRALHKSKLFGAYVGINRDGNGGFNYFVTKWEAVENGL